MSFGVSQDNWAFGNASWIWDLVFEEITVEELQEATDESLLEIVADAVDNVVADLLPGTADDLIAFAEAVAERESPSSGDTPGAEAGEPLSTGDVLSGLTTLMALADVLQGFTGQEEAAEPAPLRPSAPVGETAHAAPLLPSLPPSPPLSPPPAPVTPPPVAAAARPAVVAHPAVVAKPTTHYATIKLQAKWRLAPSSWWQLVARDNPERTAVFEGEQDRKRLQQALDAEWLGHRPSSDPVR